jgi:outer membrane receptor protein involved in Fe transport
VAEIERGPIDNNADVAYKNLTGKLEFDPSDRVQAFVRGGYFSENRNNGKVGELNDTRWTTVNGGVRARLADDSDLQARLFVDVQRAHFNFLAVTSGDDVNIVVWRRTRMPSLNGVGGGAVGEGARSCQRVQRGVRLAVGRRHARRGHIPTVPTRSPASQAATLRSSACRARREPRRVVQDIFTSFDKLVLTLSARVDRWTNCDGHFSETTVATGLPTANNRPTIPDSNDTVVSPHIAAMYHASDRISFWGAANSGFRAPTLTELYRQFSVGAVTTRPNDRLVPERLVGGEVGVNIAPARNVSFRVTWFDNKLTNPVLNVTLSPTLAQKQNIPETNVQGVQTDIEYRLGTAWRFFAAYSMTTRRSSTEADERALNGKWLRQVPRTAGRSRWRTRTRSTQP